MIRKVWWAFVPSLTAACGPAVEGDEGFAGIYRASGASASSACPPPMWEQSEGFCVLDEDMALEETLVLPAHTRVQCRDGARILPSVEGQLGIGGLAYAPSVPDTAVFVDGPGVKLQNCDIDGFTFGVVIIDLKAAPGTVSGDDRTKILGNRIVSQTHAVIVMRSDDVLLADNELETTSSSGLAVNVIRDSDRNEVVGNDIRGASHAASTEPDKVIGFPGGLPGSRLAGIDPVTQNGVYVSDRSGSPFAAYGVVVTGGSFVHLFQVAVAGRLFQNTFDGYPEDNVVAYNTFDLPGPDSQAVLLGAAPRRTSIIGNTVEDVGIGASFGSLRTQLALVPGTCSGRAPDDPRLCVVDSDCHLAGIDDPSLPGSCNAPGPGYVLNHDSLTMDTWIEDNDLTVRHTPVFAVLGLSGGIFDRGSAGTVMRDNTIRPWTCPEGRTDCPVHPVGPTVGIRISGTAIEASEVTGNVVSGMSWALVLGQTADKTATSFGADVSRNDFVGSTVRAINLRGAWTLPADLGRTGVGNYWGRDTAPGFLPTDSPLAGITDSHPFCEPVADAAILPPACP